tara:strand:- start:562 stop:1194 length:633 start_codon:yes stop_codon:yes gene_type:complete
MNIDKYKKTALIIDGEFPNNKKIIGQIKCSDIIIAVDGAANILIDNGIIPNVAVGDFDSIDSSRKDNITTIVHTKNQNKTDLEKTLDWCIDHNYLCLSIFGISGKSEDHFLGNFFIINEYADSIDCIIYTDHSTITPCIGKTIFKSFNGETVSIVSFEQENKVTSTNLEYPLDAYKLSPSARAIRNKSLGKTFTVESSDKVMVFQIKDKL